MPTILSRAPNNLKSSTILTILPCALVLLTTFLLLTRPSAPPQTLPPTTATATIRLDPLVTSKNGSEVLSQLPASAPRAAVFVAPGCTIRATDFFDASPRCPRCVGLPEERLFTLAALRRGLAVLAVSSRGKCWTHGDEVDVVESIIGWWIKEFRLEGLPLVGIGASSGGYFLSALATRVKFSSIAIMIAEGLFRGMEIPAGYPPALFVHMPKDEKRMREVGASMEALRGKGVHVREVRCDDFALTKEFLTERIPALGRGVAEGLVDVLRREGFVDEKGFLRRDGRNIPWKEAAVKGKILPEGFQWDRHVTEELNLAYAYHEFTSLKNEEIFEWFESHMDHKS